MKCFVCIANTGFEASLELGLLRIVDESGESYLYPQVRFEEIAQDAQQPQT